jgi:hypothetical protein
MGRAAEGERDVGIFSRGRGEAGSLSVVPDAERGRLAQVGRTVFAEGGYVDVSAFYLESYLQLGLPTDQFAARLVADLSAGAAASSDPWAFPGALHVAVDFDGASVATRPGGDALIDRALEVLASHGIDGRRIPMFLMARWGEINGSR